MTTEPASVKVEGLAELRLALRAVDRALPLALSRELRVILVPLKEDARRAAANQQLTPPGMSGRGLGGLAKGISSSVRGIRGYLVDKTTRGGYPYPRLYEFGHGGQRAFLTPTLNRNRDEIVMRLGEALDQALRVFGEGPYGEGY